MPVPTLSTEPPPPPTRKKKFWKKPCQGQCVLASWELLLIATMHVVAPWGRQQHPPYQVSMTSIRRTQYSPWRVSNVHMQLCSNFIVHVLANIWWQQCRHSGQNNVYYTASFVPRPFPPPVSDCPQLVCKYRGSLGDLVTCSYVR